MKDQKEIIFEFDEQHSHDNPRIHRVRFPSQQHKTFNGFMRHPKLLDAIEDLVIILLIFSVTGFIKSMMKEIEL